jgi:hypothetical protein
MSRHPGVSASESAIAQEKGLTGKRVVAALLCPGGLLVTEVTPARGPMSSLRTKTVLRSGELQGLAALPSSDQRVLWRTIVRSATSQQERKCQDAVHGAGVTPECGEGGVTSPPRPISRIVILGLVYARRDGPHGHGLARNGTSRSLGVRFNPTTLQGPVRRRAVG